MTTLLLIDVQDDFLPGGALAVPAGDQVIAVINRIVPRFDLVVATQDWHPKGHASFASNHPGKRPGDRVRLDGLDQILWPDHCVQGTGGAALAPRLDTNPIETIFRKGTDSKLDSYSAFFDNAHRRDTGLGAYLRGRGVAALHIAGLATDYCVKFSALDARQLGFDVTLIEDGCRGVNLRADDSVRAIEEMRGVGVHISNSSEILRPIQ